MTETNTSQPSRETPSVVVVDDDRALCRLLRSWLEGDGYEVSVFNDGHSALSGLNTLLPDAVCLDLNMPGLSGQRILEQLRQLHPTLPVLILTADTNVDSIVQTMRLGAYDYLAKPIQRVELSNRLRHAVESYRMSLRLVQLERDVAGTGFAGMVGRSAPMQDLYRQMDRLASSEISVLIHGESGTGKELVARALHQNSARRSAPFVPVNCAAIPETLQESELFGHEKGAFTGAATRRIGRFEQAHRGTLFLDEVAELTASAQAKLLRVLQEQSFTRVGGTQEVTSEFRLIAATHRDLRRRVEKGHFREDLYFRIAVFELDVPPLRERIDDIPALVEFFVANFAEKAGRESPVAVSDQALRALVDYQWPGNVRELQNAIQRALVASDGEDRIASEHLPPRLLQTRASNGSRTSPTGTSWNHTNEPSTPAVAESNASAPAAANGLEHPGPAAPPTGPVEPLQLVERRAVEHAIRAFDGNLSQASRALGIGRTTLYRKLERYRNAGPSES